MDAFMEDLNTLKNKIARYCAWRDRCSKEVESKLHEMAVAPEQIQTLIQWLEDEKYLDDVRFAESYVRGKHSANQWGRIRIVAELRSRNIAENIIREALKSIDSEDYSATLRRLAENKYKTVKSEDVQVKKLKTLAYLSSKGYENDLIWDVLKTIE